ncbi:MAG TPA: biopolymer transporter ExbD [Woeseiaceae bacterium]|nr:biopolymer transporter ExbD [Woeseiaceae bacterium]
MKLQTRSRPEPDVNLTPLIDVVFLLLIFFMVSTSFVRESQITIRLPEAESTAMLEAPPQRIDIMITEQGVYLVNGRELINNRPETIRNALQKVSAGNTDLPLTISADANARHQHVVTAMDVAGRLGFVRISIATVDDPADDEVQ